MGINEKDVETEASPTYQAVLGGIQRLENRCHRAELIIIILSAIILVSVVANVVCLLRGETMRIIGLTPDFRVAQVSPMTEPYVSQAGLLNFTAETITGVMALDFVRYKETLVNAKPRFSDAAFADLVRSLKSSGTLEFIKQKKLVSRVSIEKAPVITMQGEMHGHYAWRIEMPVVISYESSNGVLSSTHHVAHILVQRCPLSKNVRGIEIAQLVFK